MWELPQDPYLRTGFFYLICCRGQERSCSCWCDTLFGPQNTISALLGQKSAPDCITVLVTAEDGDGSYVLTRGFVEDMLQEFRAQRTIHPRFAYQIILQACFLVYLL